MGTMFTKNQIINIKIQGSQFQKALKYRNIIRPVLSSGALTISAHKDDVAPVDNSVTWFPPQLNQNTPSPIFGVSTGGFLRKAQVIFRYNHLFFSYKLF